MNPDDDASTTRFRSLLIKAGARLEDDGDGGTLVRFDTDTDTDEDDGDRANPPPGASV